MYRFSPSCLFSTTENGCLLLYCFVSLHLRFQATEFDLVYLEVILQLRFNYQNKTNLIELCKPLEAVRLMLINFECLHNSLLKSNKTNFICYVQSIQIAFYNMFPFCWFASEIDFYIEWFTGKKKFFTKYL